MPFSDFALFQCNVEYHFKHLMRKQSWCIYNMMNSPGYLSLSLLYYLYPLNCLEISRLKGKHWPLLITLNLLHRSFLVKHTDWFWSGSSQPLSLSSVFTLFLGDKYWALCVGPIKNGMTHVSQNLLFLADVISSICK